VTELLAQLAKSDFVAVLDDAFTASLPKTCLFLGCGAV
jgi:hypothetical protein